MKDKREIKMWIARNIDGVLKLWDKRPSGMGYHYAVETEGLLLDKTLFPEITWQNSPQEVNVEITFKQDVDCKR